jgi:hypothetical protein
MYALESGSRLAEMSTEGPDVEPGRAYWMIVSESSRVFNTGPGTTARTDTLFPIRLQNGWNLVGNPFAFPIPSTNLATGTEQALTFWRYDGVWASGTDTLLPYTGYAVFSNGADTLWIDPDLSSENLERQRSNVDRGASGFESYMSDVEGRAQLDMIFGTDTRADNEPGSLQPDVYPNPFSGSSTIEYRLREDTQVTVTVFDVLGRNVATLLDRRQRAGQHRLRWNGGNRAGQRATPGTYLLQISTLTESHTTLITTLH